MTGPLVAAVVAAGACFAYRPAALAPVPGSRVRVVLTTAVAVATYAGGRDRPLHTYPGVLEASGVIQGAAADTIALRLGELRTAGGPVPDVAGRLAMLATAHIAHIEERRFQAGTTALVALGVLALAATTYVLLLIVEITQGF